MTQTEITEKGGLSFHTRPDTLDNFVLKEVFTKSEYSRLDIKPEDVVLDLGMNIGAFTCYAKSRGAATVIGMEPEPENFELSTLNVERNGFSDGSTLIDAAAIGGHEPTATFSVSVKANKGTHSLLDKPGRDTITVKCVNINDVIAQYSPTIVKMDIEGGEYDVIKSITSWGRVDQLIMEFHHSHLNDMKTGEKYREILDLLRAHFTKVDHLEDPQDAWASVIYCTK